MPGIESLIENSRAYFRWCMQTDRLDRFNRFLHVAIVVERFYFLPAVLPRQRPSPRGDLIQIFGIFHLDVSRIEEHGLAQAGRRRRSINWSAETVLDQRRQAPAVIQVRMRQHYGANRG